MLNKYYLFLSFVLVSALTLGQTYTDQTTEEAVDEVIEIEEGVDRSTVATPAIFNLLGINNQTNSRNSTIEGNSIFLTQVGQFNTATIATATNSSEISLLQNGTSNDAELSYRANTAVVDIEQNGNLNVVRDFVNSPDADVSLDLEQNGDGLRFERIGTNSITRSLQFKQTEASPTIIIRSFN